MAVMSVTLPVFQPLRSSEERFPQLVNMAVMSVTLLTSQPERLSVSRFEHP